MHVFQFLTACATLWCVLCRDAVLKKSCQLNYFPDYSTKLQNLLNWQSCFSYQLKAWIASIVSQT